MSLILANSSDIISGKPIPWSLYNQEYILLLSEGDVVRDDKHRDELLSSGAYRELSWETSGSGAGNDGTPLAFNESASVPAESGKADPAFTFDDMRLKAEDRLQLEPPSQLARERVSVKVIGYLRG